MDMQIRRVKSFNIFLFFLIAVQFAILMGVAVILMFSLVIDIFSILSVISYALLLLLSLPLSVLLYKSSTDGTLKAIFFGLMANFTLLSISGFLWYILPLSFDFSWLVTAGKTAMVLAYLPIIYTFFVLFKAQHEKIEPYMKIFIIFINITSALLILYFVLANIQWGSSNTFNIIIYTLCTLADVVILAMSAILILAYMPTQLRYIFSITFIYFILSFAGDSLTLIDYLGLYENVGGSQFFYDVMLIFMSVALLVYSLSNIKTITVEEVNKKLSDTRLLMDDLITQSPDAMCIHDTGGVIVRANAAFYDLFYLNKDDVIGKFNIFEHMFRMDDGIRSKILKVKDGETAIINEVKLDLMVNDDARYVTIKMFPTYDSEGMVSSYITMVEDITERKRSEEALKRAYDELEMRVKERTAELGITNEALQKEILEHKADEEKIKASLKEKEVLLKEIHHRVKNNLQIVSSLLNLQSSNIKDKHYQDMFRESQNRIRSMALIHEKLYQSKDLARVDFAEYLRSLTTYLSHSYRSEASGISIVTNIDEVSLNIDSAIPWGLIINELVSNSYKHAFPDGRRGEICVEFHSNGNCQYVLKVRDDGIGLPESLDIYNTTSLGLQLVHILAEELNCSMKVERSNGTCYTLTCSNAEQKGE
ncbi:hypothetical protein CUJ83_11265 [Methanocella sp. CWC-04]|uniref:PAS domain S-box-containing protein n=1 Tax=Methanooceanicella nereidis TaxID=2052831 RepID=A0AAP2RDY4_9EURY|nr:histidine kinase dimerization/phosphoacceptor domain -containing protein [Methanocella sp. CWC-04]MCD1295578.1 hypothetical protein [Methanocella sp. CWC-04]